MENCWHSKLAFRILKTCKRSIIMWSAAFFLSYSPCIQCMTLEVLMHFYFSWASNSIYHHTTKAKPLLATLQLSYNWIWRKKRGGRRLVQIRTTTLTMMKLKTRLKIFQSMSAYFIYLLRVLCLQWSVHKCSKTQISKSLKKRNKRFLKARTWRF